MLNDLDFQNSPWLVAATLPTHCQSRIPECSKFKSMFHDHQPHPETNLGVVLEAAGGLAGGEVPEAEGLVPRAGEGEVAVGGEHHVGDEVAVPVQPLLRDAVLGLIPEKG